MPWQEVDPRYVRQDHPGLSARWFCDASGRGQGELLMWLDERGRLVGFQLDRQEWPSLRHYVADWRAGTDVRIGEVDEGDRAAGALGVKPAALLRFPRLPDPRAARRLLGYFRQNAAVLDPPLRQAIAAILGEATGSDAA